MTREDEVRAAYVEGLKDMSVAVRKGLQERKGTSVEVEVDVEASWLASDAFKGLGEPVE